MKKSILDKQKRRGRPATGQTPMMGFRATEELRGKIVHWAEFQPDTPKLSEAVRRLVELGLTVKTKAKQTSAARADRAKELATKAIGKIIDPVALPEERAQRRRSLTKGPPEFREARVDQPKAKGKWTAIANDLGRLRKKAACGRLSETAHPSCWLPRN
jgi:hypothetical protein